MSDILWLSVTRESQIKGQQLSSYNAGDDDSSEIVDMTRQQVIRNDVEDDWTPLNFD